MKNPATQTWLPIDQADEFADLYSLRRKPAAATRRQPVSRRASIIVVVAAITLHLLLWAWLSVAVRSSRSSTPEKPVAPPEPEFSVTATELVHHYETNEIAGDQRYKNTWLLVEGQIQGIGKDILEQPYLTLEGPADSFRRVQCFFDKAWERQLSVLRPQLKVVVRCRGNGLMGNVLLKECTLRPDADFRPRNDATTSVRTVRVDKKAKVAHRYACPLMKDKIGYYIRIDEAQADGYSACKVCDPYRSGGSSYDPR